MALPSRRSAIATASAALAIAEAAMESHAGVLGRPSQILIRRDGQSLAGTPPAHQGLKLVQRRFVAPRRLSSGAAAIEHREPVTDRNAHGGHCA